MVLLGYLVTDAGIKPNPSKELIFRNWPIPKSIRELRKLLGLACWFRRFIFRFAEIVAPL